MLLSWSQPLLTGRKVMPGIPGLLVAERYRLDESIGQGGMGRVWRAADVILDRPVAVKEMRMNETDVEDTRIRRERTMREARATARIDHPNVVRVYDVVEESDRLWIVMELVDSRSLEQLLVEQGPVTPREAARIGLGLAAALHEVHARGVLHRDIKPGNVLLGRAGRIVLTDFGIAAIQDAKALTVVGMLVGSPDYMAPERVGGRPQGPASDLWSLGATLCAALAGRSPFARPTTLATLHAVLYEEPELPDGAGPLAGVLASLLVKEPDERPTLDALEPVLARVASSYVPTRAVTVVVPAPEGGGAEGEPGEGAQEEPEPVPGEREGEGEPRQEPEPGEERVPEPAPEPEPADARPEPAPAPAPAPGPGPGPGPGPDAEPADARPEPEPTPESPPDPPPPDGDVISAPTRRLTLSPRRAVPPHVPTTSPAPAPGPEPTTRPEAATSPVPTATSTTTPATDESAASLPLVSQTGAPTGPAGPDTPQPPSRSRARTRAVVLAAALATVAAATTAAVLLTSGEDPDVPGAGAQSPGATSAPATTAPPTTAPATPPPGTRSEAGFAWAPPHGWTRTAKSPSNIHYHSPDGQQEIAASYALARGGDLLTQWEQFERDSHDAPGYRKIRLERTTFRGDPAIVWEYFFTQDGSDWRARQLGFTAGGKSYQLNVWYDVASQRAALAAYDRVTESFSPL
ncbi:serine/threonine-protein kinase [Streptomyces sp. NBC_01167]|uniref:serine/threonine-protein kinase n=1 Tax=Streptomyces sp. NBC_01167 TaxID=2903756 RepID=UPI003865C598